MVLKALDVIFLPCVAGTECVCVYAREQAGSGSGDKAGAAGVRCPLLGEPLHCPPKSLVVTSVSLAQFRKF